MAGVRRRLRVRGDGGLRQGVSESMVVFSPPGERTALVFDRDNGSCLQGPFEGKSLRPVPGTAVYWGIWAQFHPDTTLVSR